jgi:hypothetical protein
MRSLSGNRTRGYQMRVERKAELEEKERKRKLEAERRERERLKRLEQGIDRLLKDAASSWGKTTVPTFVPTLHQKR